MEITSLDISDSSINLLWSCPRKLQLHKFFEHSRREESLAMGLGSALHTGYQNYWLNGNKEESLVKMAIEYPYKYLESSTSQRGLPAATATLEMLMRTEEYTGYELAWFEHNGEKRPGIEVPFAINIKNFSLDDKKEIPVRYIGYIDLVLRSQLQGSYKIVDIKTTARSLTDYSPLYQNSDQCLPYGYVIEAVTSEVVDTLDVDYLVAYTDLLEPRIQKYTFMKNQDDIQGWARHLYMSLQMIKTYYQANWFPKRNNCYGFNRPCQHFEYCGATSDKLIDEYLRTQATTPRLPIVPWVEIDLDLTGG